MMPNDPPKNPETTEDQFYFNPPDTTEVLSGLNSPANVYNPIDLQFEIRTGSKAIGMMASGELHYEFTNQTRCPPYPPNPPESLDDQPWAIGTRYGAASTFPYGHQLDYIETHLRYMTYPMHFYTSTQSFRYVWVSPRDETKELMRSIGSHTIERHKVSPTEWELRK